MITGGYNPDCDAVIYGVKLDLYADLVASPLPSLDIDTTGIIFSVVASLDVEDKHLAYVGNSVNFWSPPNNPALINIYCRGGTGGAGKIGVVPNAYLAQIRHYMDSGLCIDATLESKHGDMWKIKCRLIPAHETAQKFDAFMALRKQGLLSELVKPYRPRKPVQFKLYLPAPNLVKGDVLCADAIPSIGDIASTIEIPSVEFCCVRTGLVFSYRCDLLTLKKMMRLHRQSSPLLAVVKSVKIEFQSNYCVTICLRTT